jgi:drug/metabolite transporter (DMT)-like permease
MIKNLSTYSKGTIAGVAATILWATTAAFIVAAEGVHPFLYSSVGMTVGFLLYCLRWLYLKQNPLPALRKVPWWYLAGGVLGIGIHGVAWVAAMRQAPPLEALLFIYQWPMLVVVFTAIALRQRLQFFHYLAILFGLVGIFILLIGRGLDLGQFTFRAGHGWGIVSAVSWGLYSALSAKHPNVTPYSLGFIFLGIGIVNFLIWALYLGAPLPSLQSFLICGAGAMLSMSGYILWDYGIKNGDARTIAFTSFLIPILSSLLLVLTGQAQFSIYSLLAFIVVIAGIAIARFGKKLKLKI